MAFEDILTQIAGQNFIYQRISDTLGISLQSAFWFVLIGFILINIWRLIWYSLAIYKTLEKAQKNWFVILVVVGFIIDIFAILAIVYLIIERNKKDSI